jgi:flavin-dependent dehydrogenase
MSPLPKQVDLTVIGAGTAGSAAALFAARAGLRVLCVDRAPLDRAGAHWVNGVPQWLHQSVGLEEPSHPELRGHAHRFHLVAGFEGPRVIVQGHQVQEVDMRHLGKRLRDEASSHGATLVGEVQVRSVEDTIVDTSEGSVKSRWVVDASGMNGLNLLDSPKVGKSNICAAAQEVRHCDPAAASDFFHQHGVAPGDTLCFSGVAGGYSIINVHVKEDRLSILTGSIPGEGHPSGRQMLDDFVAKHSWIGDREFGGSKAIPIRRSHDRIASGSHAALGDAASQVFPAHGSGIAPQIVAAHMLASNLESGRGLQGYAVQYQRELGARLAGYDVFRRFSQDLSADDLARLIHSGVMTQASTRAALEQRMPDMPRAGELLGYARGLFSEPRMAARLARVAARMLSAQELYKRYPRAPEDLGRWTRWANRLFDEQSQN